MTFARKLAMAGIFTLAGIGSAMAQAQPAVPQGKATQPAAARPAPQQPAPTARPVPTNPGTFTITDAQIRAINDGVRAKAAACAAKGNLYKWVPPHAPGDLSPTTGKPYKGMSLGSCKLRTTRDLIDAGVLKVQN